MNQAYLTTSVSPKGIKSGTRTIDERPGDPVFLKDMRKFSMQVIGMQMTSGGLNHG
ncbi:MAG: hypothetical protein ACI9LX_001422 [Paraglaciecola sp.]|jgi:hypothetical protein